MEALKTVTEGRLRHGLFRKEGAHSNSVCPFNVFIFTTVSWFQSDVIRSRVNEENGCL